MPKIFMNHYRDLPTENPYREHLVCDGLKHHCVIDGLKPKNRDIARFIHLLDTMHHNEIIDFHNDFFVLSPFEYDHMRTLYCSHHGLLPNLTGYRGNWYTADIYLRDYPFVDFKQLFVVKK